MDRSPTYSFPKKNRLLYRRDFLKVQRKGKRIDLEFFLVLVLRGPNSTPRVGITTSRRTGKAVFRNRIRRLVRDASRRLLLSLPYSVDIVIIARKKIPKTIRQDQVDQAFFKLIQWLEKNKDY